MNKTKIKLFVMQMERLMESEYINAPCIRGNDDETEHKQWTNDVDTLLTNFFCDKNEHFTSGEYLTSEYFDSLYEELFDLKKPLSHPTIVLFYSTPYNPDIDSLTSHLLIKCNEGVVVDVSITKGENEAVKINNFIEGKWQKDIERIYRELFYDTLIIPFSLWEKLALD